MLFLLISSCSSKMNERRDVEKNTTLNRVEDSLYYAIDSIFENGTNIKLVGNFNTSEITLTIKSDQLDTSYNFCEILKERCIGKYGPYNILWTTDDFIGIRESCGSPCYYEIVIPLKSGYFPSSYMFPYTNAESGFSLSSNLIAYNGTTKTADGYPIIKIKNLLNGKMDSLEIDDSWKGRVAMNEFVDTIYATNQEFFIGQLDKKGNLIAQKRKAVKL